MKKDKGTSDKATNIAVATKRIKFVIGLLAQKTIRINKIIATNLLRGSRR